MGYITFSIGSWKGVFFTISLNMRRIYVEIVYRNGLREMFFCKPSIIGRMRMLALTLTISYYFWNTPKRVQIKDAMTPNTQPKAQQGEMVFKFAFSFVLTQNYFFIICMKKKKFAISLFFAPLIRFYAFGAGGQKHEVFKHGQASFMENKKQTIFASAGPILSRVSEKIFKGATWQERESLSLGRRTAASVQGMAA